MFLTAVLMEIEVLWVMTPCTSMDYPKDARQQVSLSHRYCLPIHTASYPTPSSYKDQPVTVGAYSTTNNPQTRILGKWPVCVIQSRKDWFLGAFTKLRKAATSFVMSVRPSAQPPPQNNSAPNEWTFSKFDIRVFLQNLSKKFKFH
jgi:hypothetical protein